ncbi:protein BREAKING OF ASYMMETRY IN THE STOMATAL LINEAGE [Trifolium repens]|nr:protein BREAKING OF ASYMMETRY IN THE STOMATAL LINEAGE [Trifolium repens]
MTSSSRGIARSATFDKRTVKTLNKNQNSNLSQPIKKGSKRHLNEEPATNDKVINDFDDSNRSFFSEEEFIVFCFEEDGPFDVVKDDKGVVHKYARPFILKGGEKEGNGIMSLESRDSVHSKDSTGSFAFPVLDNWEWIGSPAQMPKLEGPQQLKKQKANSMRFQCCKFS